MVNVFSLCLDLFLRYKLSFDLRLAQPRHRFRPRSPCSITLGFESREVFIHRKGNERCWLKAKLMKNLTLCLWQYASISFLSWVVALILKKTSYPSWDLTLRLSCSAPGVGSDIFWEIRFDRFENYYISRSINWLNTANLKSWHS